MTEIIENKCTNCNRTIPIWQEMCRECSFEIYNDILTPEEMEFICGKEGGR